MKVFYLVNLNEFFLKKAEVEAKIGDEVWIDIIFGEFLVTSLDAIYLGDL